MTKITNITSLTLVCFLIALQIVDIVTTKIGLDNGAIEINPIVNYLIEQFGILPALIVFKSIFIIILFVIAINNMIIGLFRQILIAVCFIYTIIAINNVITLLYCM